MNEGPWSRSLRPPDRAGPAWEELVREIETCERCPLHRTRTHVVIHRGSFSPSLLFVGEAPGAKEDLEGRPFVGRSGALLDRAIASLRLPEAAVAVINVVKCRPPGNRFVEEAARACRPFLDRQLEQLAPRLIVPLGAHALRSFAPDVRRLTDVTGRPLSLGNRLFFPLLHPAATLRSRAMRTRWESDLRALARYLAPQAGEP